MMNEHIYGSFLQELEKISESDEPKAKKKKKTLDRAMDAGPGIGAVIGGTLGAAAPDRLEPEKLVKALAGRPVARRVGAGVIGAGIGASTGWLPATIRDASRAIRGKD
jgi:hypothetical protein